MFLVIDRRLGMTHWVFTWEDPRRDGYAGEVVEQVDLDYDMEHVHQWPNGDRRPEPVLGRDPKNQNRYKVFRCYDDLRAEGFERLPGQVFPVGSWNQYRNIFNIPEGVDEPAWHDYLDEMDDAARRRRASATTPDRPDALEQAAVASWVARKHMDADSGIRAVLHMPTNAPPNEIRLLEVNDRIAGGEIQPIEFGLEVEDRVFRLLIVDVNSDQLEELEFNPALLPVGWSLRDGQVWRRRA